MRNKFLVDSALVNAALRMHGIEEPNPIARNRVVQFLVFSSAGKEMINDSPHVLTTEIYAMYKMVEYITV